MTFVVFKYFTDTSGLSGQTCAILEVSSVVTPVSAGMFASLERVAHCSSLLLLEAGRVTRTHLFN